MPPGLSDEQRLCLTQGRLAKDFGMSIKIVKLPNAEVIILEKSKEDIFVLLLPDQEEFNILDSDKKDFAQLVGTI